MMQNSLFHGSFLAAFSVNLFQAILTSYTSRGNGAWGEGFNWSNGVLRKALRSTFLQL